MKVAAEDHSEFKGFNLVRSISVVRGFLLRAEGGSWASPLGCLGRHTGSSLLYILPGSCSRAPTRLMTCEAGWSVSYSAKRWHTFSWDSVWLLATNPKILMGEESLGEESPGRHKTGSWGTQPFPSPSPAQHLLPALPQPSTSS